jgi:exodeoxyribonuclease I
MEAAHTFVWHDYETFGANVRLDRPAQFAAIRTDAALNEIGDPVVLYCQPSPDYLPDPESCLITGITPQLCLEKGIPEAAFAAAIDAVLGQPGTIGVGYNSIRFDDEITRHMLWRNLSDPYAREWQNGCGRWDLLDVVRTAYALRPEGIQWPQRPEDGGPSFRLAHLSAANGLAHEAAHDALSDVRATIALARLIRQAQPRLFDFCLSLHKKDRVMAELGLPAMREQAHPFLHISGMFPADRGCLALMWPLAQHPSNKNEILAWDLSHDPRELLQASADDLRQRLFTPTAQLPEGLQRLPLKSVHVNKSPIVIRQLKILSVERARHWGLDLERCLQNAVWAAALPDMSAIWAEVYRRPPAQAPDVEQDLYGGFVGPADRRRLQQLKALKPEELALARSGFDDARLSELLFRYRARNHPLTLNPDEQVRWRTHCAARLLGGEGGARTVTQVLAHIDELADQAMAREDERAESILSTLHDYVSELGDSLA